MAVILLAVAVGAVVGRPSGLPPWLIPPACALSAVATGAVGPADAGRALEAMAGPVAFLLAAVPLAVLLDQLGFFAAVADQVSRRGPAALWWLAAAVTTLLNLDASVVLLTPLYVEVARRTGRDPLALAIQPVLLACLASSALPVSNLTNLVAVAHTDAGLRGFLGNLALPSLVATVVGWFCYRRTFGGLAATPPVDRPAERSREGSTGGRHARAVPVGAAVLSVTVAGFVAGPSIGLPPWAVAVAADVVLIGVLRRPPWRHLPAGTAVTVGSLAVLAAGATNSLPVKDLLGAPGTAGLARTVAGTAVAANLVNNLPALLVALPALGRQASPALWATLLGVNMGPVLLVSGSLASLLWLDTLHRLGVEVHPRQFSRLGVLIGLPAVAAATATLLVIVALR